MGKIQKNLVKKQFECFPRSTLVGLLSCILIQKERGSPKKD